MGVHTGGVVRRLTTLAAASALAVGTLSGLAAPAHAVPVTVTGTLTDTAGNALDGYVEAYVLAGDGTYDFSDFEYVDDGLIRLSLEPGTYKFAFESASGGHISEYYNDKADLATADAVAVTGNTGLAPVQLAAHPQVTGSVVGPSGRPVAGGSVSLYDTAEADQFADAFGQIKGDGTFSVGAPPGNYKVRIEPQGFAAEWYSNKGDFATADVVALPATGAGLGVVNVTRGTTISGRVTNTAGAPLERVQVSDGFRSDLTDANGVYVLEDVPAGRYALRFTDPVGEYLSEYYHDKATEATADLVAVSVDTPVAGIDEVLANDPDAAVDPAAVDLSGTVTDSAGAPVIGADVLVYTTPDNPAAREAVFRATTTRAGTWAITHVNERNPETQYKVQVVDDLDREDGQYWRQTRWYGGAQSYDLAAPVGVPAAGVNVTLPLTGGVSGKITSESSLPVENTWVSFYSVHEGEAEGSAFVEDDGTYVATFLTPGKYKVRFGDNGVPGATDRHGPEWYDNTSFAGAKVITVSSGKTTTSINAALAKGLRALRKPEIKGNPYIGGKVTAYPGVWSLETGTDFTYEWLVKGEVVATGQSLSLGKSYKNDRVTLRVTAANGSLEGIAMTTSQKIEKKPKVKLKVAGSSASFTIKGKGIKPAKIKGSVLVKRVKGEDLYGAPKYAKAGKAKFKNGAGKVALKKLQQGKNKLVFFFKIKGKLGDATVTKTVKVRR